MSLTSLTGNMHLNNLFVTIPSVLPGELLKRVVASRSKPLLLIDFNSMNISDKYFLSLEFKVLFRKYLFLVYTEFYLGTY
jgi:hypothetical protein